VQEGKKDHLKCCHTVFERMRHMTSATKDDAPGNFLNIISENVKCSHVCWWKGRKLNAKHGNILHSGKSQNNTHFARELNMLVVHAQNKSIFRCSPKSSTTSKLHAVQYI